MKKRCQAENPECGLETGTSIFNGSLKCIKCDVCCAEPGFCRECKCVLCGKVIKTFSKDNFIFRCHQRISEAGVCGHASHMDCALNAKMAEVVAHCGIDMEYLCRRCDKKTDLKGLVTHMLADLGVQNMRSYAQSNLIPTLWNDQGTLCDDNATGISETLVLRALEKIQSGEDIREVLRELCDRYNLEQENEALQREASLDQWLPSISSTANHISALPSPSDLQSNPVNGTSPVTSSRSCEIADPNNSSTHTGESVDPLTKQCASHHSLKGTKDAEDKDKQADSLTSSIAMEKVQKHLVFKDPEKSEVETFAAPEAPVAFDSTMSDLPSGESRGTRLAETSNDAMIQTMAEITSKAPDTTPIAPGALSHTPELLDSQYDSDIKDALKKLKERQKRKFSMKRDRLLALKNDLLNQHQELELARHDLVRQAPTMSLESVNALIKKISALAACMERQKMSFEAMLWSCETKGIDTEG
ncbi:hypothetical protein O6H91_01G135600 [Diphasiastrum complanatum]|uniref:Uncharacterized protein n=1 Tax=Diphasiastrum complanatum TaxID=34168 RepID=A0ACC2EWC8_DIPCM|nr:hypothetical protein O6H91_01G135600 [Diphasiastrum complanatum]